LKKLPQMLSVIFLGAVLFMILRGQKVMHFERNPALFDSLITASHEGYTPLGWEMEPYKRFLPDHGVFGLIMDEPYEEAPLARQKVFHRAKNFLVPVILTYKPTEEFAIIHCANDEVARKRLEETGYQWFKKIGAGKGIVRKK